MKQDGIVFRILETAAIAVAYFVLARIGLSLSILQVTPVWPPSGLALALVLLRGYRVLPGILIGHLMMDFLNTYDSTRVLTSVMVIALLASGSVLSAATGGFLVKRYARGERCLDRARDAFLFAGLGAMLGPIIAATFGVIGLHLGRFIPISAVQTVWFTWCMGDMAGAFLFAPAILAWVRNPPHSLNAKMILEGLMLACFASLVTLGAFVLSIPEEYHAEYMLLPFLVWAAFRFELRGASALTLLISAIAVTGTIRGYSSFSTGWRNESLLALQSFLIVISMTALLLCSVLEERKHRTNQLLRAIDRAETARIEAAEANRARTLFLANMSHELRTPLNHIIGYSDLLKEQLEDSKSREMLPDVARINEAGKHLLSMIGGILDLSALEAGKAELKVEHFDLAQVLNQVIAELRPLLEKNANVLSPDSIQNPIEMYGDKTRVAQVFWNVLHNACKFTINGNVTVQVKVEQGTVHISVADTGIGMSPDQLAKLFRPFMQGDSGTTKKYGGMGLGLSVSSLYCQMMGGKLSASSEIGKGSIFEIQFPLGTATF